MPQAGCEIPDPCPDPAARSAEADAASGSRITWITVCETCRRPGRSDAGAVADGAMLADLVAEAAATIPTLQVRRHACLMGCPRACNVVVQAAGKLAYSLADFTPDRAAAEAIVAWAAQHAESETGQVPYREWPQGVRGHFVSRHPPLPG